MLVQQIQDRGADGPQFGLHHPSTVLNQLQLLVRGVSFLLDVQDDPPGGPAAPAHIRVGQGQEVALRLEQHGAPSPSRPSLLMTISS